MRDVMFGAFMATVGWLLATQFLPSPAQPVRLIGECGGRYFAAMEEDMFPSDCEWIEPIRVDVQ